jgi:hypothetical protein
LSCLTDHKDQNVRATLIWGEEKVEPVLHSCHNDVINKESEQPSTTYDAKPFLSLILKIYLSIPIC